MDKERQEYLENGIKESENGGGSLTMEEKIFFQKYDGARKEFQKAGQEVKQLQNQIKRAQDRVRELEADMITATAKAESYLDAAASLHFLVTKAPEGGPDEEAVPTDPAVADVDLSGKVDSAGRLETN